MLSPNISRWPHFLLVWHDSMESYGRGPERLYNIGSNKSANSGVVKHARDCQIPFRLIFIILITPILASKVHPSTHRAPPSLNCHGTHHARVSFVAHRNVGGEGPKVLQRQSKYALAYHHLDIPQSSTLTSSTSDRDSSNNNSNTNNKAKTNNKGQQRPTPITADHNRNHQNAVLYLLT